MAVARASPPLPQCPTRPPPSLPPPFLLRLLPLHLLCTNLPPAMPRPQPPLLPSKLCPDPPSILHLPRLAGADVDESSSHISVIRLLGKKLSKSLPPVLFSLSFIHTLDLSSNGFFNSIPMEAFSNLSFSLRYLNLTSNKLFGPVPLQSNDGDKIFDSNLKILDLSNNYLAEEIPDKIYNFTNLKLLDLDGYFLHGGEAS